MAHTPLKIPSKKKWYFDSECARHMTGDKRQLKEIRPFSEGYAVDGDGIKRRVEGI
ncbi:gag-pol polyprotein, partial [Trifolium medium]|nr:gag-pol polyprotein [Trifolium medium]